MGHALTDPVTLAGRRAPARVIFGPHETNLGVGRSFSDRHVAYYERRAAGGAGVIVTETASVHLLDHPYERAPLAAQCGPGWERIVAACHRHGTRVLAGLGHSGLQGSSAWTEAPLWAPSRVADPATRELPAAMTAGQVRTVIAAFADATRIAVAAGADGVELDAGPTALLRQFLSGLTNHRDDAYGRDRTRLVREVLAAVRAQLGPGRILALRLSCDENAPWGGITPEHAARWARRLAPSLDLLTVVRGGLFTPETYRPDAHTPATANDALCRTIRDAVAGGVPVALQGGVVDPGHARRALDTGVCDLVEMTRAQIADPDLVRTVRAGRRPRPCVRCNQGCLVRDFRNPEIGCSGNAEAGRETVRQGPAVPRTDVLVVGGGPAGLAAARSLAHRGCRVVLAERGGRLGGATVGTPFAALTDWLADRCRALGVEVRLGTRVTAADLAAARAAGTRVVLATGGTPRPAAFPVGAGGHRITPTAVLAAPESVPSRVLVWDPEGGPVAVAVAERLAAAGHEVHYATSDPIAGSRLAPTGDLVAANTRLHRAGVVRHLGVTVVGVDGDRARMRHRVTGQETAVPGAAVVDCSPPLPDTALRCGPVVAVGDCVAPRTVRDAIREGHERAHALYRGGE